MNHTQKKTTRDKHNSHLPLSSHTDRFVSSFSGFKISYSEIAADGTKITDGSGTSFVVFKALKITLKSNRKAPMLIYFILFFLPEKLYHDNLIMTHAGRYRNLNSHIVQQKPPWRGGRQQVKLENIPIIFHFTFTRMPLESADCCDYC